MRQIDCLSVDVLVTLRCLHQGPHNVFCVESRTFYTLWFKKNPDPTEFSNNKYWPILIIFFCTENLQRVSNVHIVACEF